MKEESTDQNYFNDNYSYITYHSKEEVQKFLNLLMLRCLKDQPLIPPLIYVFLFWVCVDVLLLCRWWWLLHSCVIVAAAAVNWDPLVLQYLNLIRLFKNQNSERRSNVVCKVDNREKKLKAVSNPVWVCWKAMIEEKTIKEE